MCFISVSATLFSKCRHLIRRWPQKFSVGEQGEPTVVHGSKQEALVREVRENVWQPGLVWEMKGARGKKTELWSIRLATKRRLK